MAAKLSPSYNYGCKMRQDRKAELDGSASHLVPRVRDFTDLQVWQLARNLRQEKYCLVRALPTEERYALSRQFRRAATSITANIAEGFGRCSFQENIQFCRLARGSAYEIRDHLITAKDQGFLSDQDYHRIEILAQRVIQTLNGYIRSTKARQKAESVAKL